MKNKMATPLGMSFSTVENQVSQCDDQTFGSIAETLVITLTKRGLNNFSLGVAQAPYMCARRLA